MGWTYIKEYERDMSGNGRDMPGDSTSGMPGKDRDMPGYASNMHGSLSKEASCR